MANDTVTKFCQVTNFVFGEKAFFFFVIVLPMSDKYESTPFSQKEVLLILQELQNAPVEKRSLANLTTPAKKERVSYLSLF